MGAPRAVFGSANSNTLTLDIVAGNVAGQAAPDLRLLAIHVRLKGAATATGVFLSASIPVAGTVMAVLNHTIAGTAASALALNHMWPTDGLPLTYDVANNRARITIKATTTDGDTTAAAGTSPYIEAVAIFKSA